MVEENLRSMPFDRKRIGKEERIRVVHGSELRVISKHRSVGRGLLLALSLGRSLGTRPLPHLFNDLLLGAPDL